MCSLSEHTKNHSFEGVGFHLIHGHWKSLLWDQSRRRGMLSWFFKLLGFLFGAYFMWLRSEIKLGHIGTWTLHLRHPPPPQLRDKWLRQSRQDTAHWISYQMLNEFKRLQLWKQMLSLRVELWLGRRSSLGTKGVQVSKGERSHKPAWRKLSNSRVRWAWHYILLPIRS